MEQIELLLNIAELIFYAAVIAYILKRWKK